MTEYEFTLLYEITGEFDCEYIINILHSQDKFDCLLGWGLGGFVAINVIDYGNSEKEVVTKVKQHISDLKLGLGFLK